MASGGSGVDMGPICVVRVESIFSPVETAQTSS